MAHGYRAGSTKVRNTGKIGIRHVGIGEASLLSIAVVRRLVQSEF
jgi:hypothetical protein